MSEPLLVASGVCRSYASGAQTIEVLRGLDLEVHEGQSVAVVGESGVGKSTLLHALGGLDRPDRGEIRFRGESVYRRSPPELAAFRNRRVGFVFQFHHLLPEFTALENVELPLRIGRRRGGPGESPRRLLERLGLGERLRHYPGALSGGEQQRVAIARALASAPALVVADEPTGNLDPRTAEQVFDVFAELQRELGFSLVVASHNARLCSRCDRVLRLQHGALHALAAGETSRYFDGLGA